MRTRRFLICCFVAWTLAGVGPSGLVAQTLTVQQPVVDVFNVSTVVSVPDRGSALLGGVSRAADASGRYGFSPGGSSLGADRSNTTATAHVYIHDLADMDAALLATPTARTGSTSVPANPLAARAFHSLQDRPGTSGTSRWTASVEAGGVKDRDPDGVGSAGDRFAQSLAASQRLKPADNHGVASTTPRAPQSRRSESAVKRFGRSPAAVRD